MTAVRPIVRIDFSDFGFRYNKTDNFFYNLLKDRFEPVICDQPDFLFYSDYGDVHRLHTCAKIFVTWESSRPDFRACDYALTMHYLDDPRHLRLPFYVMSGDPGTLMK